LSGIRARENQEGQNRKEKKIYKRERERRIAHDSFVSFFYISTHLT
jgi:hypothetical protein